MIVHPTITALLTNLLQRGFIDHAEYETMQTWIGIDPSINQAQILAILAYQHYQRKGHIAIDEKMANEHIESFKLKNAKISIDDLKEGCSLIGSDSDYEPFIVHNQLLYDHKSYNKEKVLAHWLIHKAKQSDEDFIGREDEIQSSISDSLHEHQRECVFKSFTNKFLIITGGPGSGKTFTISEIIKQHRNFFDEEYIIKVAAPTGKAAQRINDSLAGFLEENEKAVTVHQLLGASDVLKGYSRNKENPIDADLVIIDEASMMDLGIWHALSQSLAEDSTVIVVGDPFQLAAVEAGAVLRDIHLYSNNSSEFVDPIQECVVSLDKRFRFSESSGIHHFADAINASDVEKATEILASKEFSDVQFVELGSNSISETLQKYAINNGVKTLPKVDAFKILTALRKGNLGCDVLNTRVENKIKIERRLPRSIEWFNSRMVMISKNNYQLGIQNGEIGIYSNKGDEIIFSEEKKLKKEMLKYYESGYCITIHKSQGSEYDHIAIILPDKENPILTKELLYTAVTRARESVLVVGKSEILNYCISNKTIRKSGLHSQLKQVLVDSGPHQI